MARPESYRDSQKCCRNCVFSRPEVDEEWYCTKNVDPMPEPEEYTGILIKDLEIDLRYMEAYYLWQEAHVVSEYGICDEWTEHSTAI